MKKKQKITLFTTKYGLQKETQTNNNQLIVKIKRDKFKYTVFSLFIVLFLLSLIFGITMLVILPATEKDFKHKNNSPINYTGSNDFKQESMSSISPFSSKKSDFENKHLYISNEIPAAIFNNFNFFIANIETTVTDYKYITHDIKWTIDSTPISKIRMDLPTTIDDNFYFEISLDFFISSYLKAEPKLVLVIIKAPNDTFRISLFSIFNVLIPTTFGDSFPSMESYIKLDFHFYNRI